MTLFLLYSLFSVIHDISHPEPPFSFCDTATFPDNSPFRSTLDHLLSSLPSHPVQRYFTTSIGNGSNKIYGLFLCYTYAPEDECQECIQKSLPTDITKRCMYKYEAVVWEEYCLFHYSTRNFSGQLNFTGNIPLSNKNNFSNPEEIRRVANETLHNLTKVAAFDSSYMNSSGSKHFTGGDTLYAFVQCSKDLSPRNCSTCLETAIAEILDSFYFSRGARLLSSSCFLRYELYGFYDGASEVNSSGTNQKWKIAVIGLASGILVLVACCVFYLVSRNRTRSKSETSVLKEMKMEARDNMELTGSSFGLQHNVDLKEFPFIEMNIIEEATDNFSDLYKLGEGGFGPVYKGVLPDRQEIAVKRMSSESEQGSNEFINEVLLIHKLQHVNLVKLLGFCVHDEEKLLVYEYMPNSSLDGFLRDSRKRAQLNWSTRINIIKGVSRGMLYLHQDSRLKIIHRDLKPSNVLLDAHMNPKISDFGMARIFGGHDGEANTVKIVGTYGYMAPEFAMEGLYSVKSDVFSFGVLLLEIITGKRNAGFHLTNLESTLVAYAWRLWNEGKEFELMDPLLKGSCQEEEFLRCFHIGLLCIQEDAHDRPTMPSVMLMLNRDTVTLSRPEKPAFSDGKFLDHYQTCFNNLSLNELTASALFPR